MEWSQQRSACCCKSCFHCLIKPASSTSQGILPSVITTPSGLSLLQLRWKGILAVRTPAQPRCHWDSQASSCPPSLPSGPTLCPLSWSCSGPCCLSHPLDSTASFHHRGFWRGPDLLGAMQTQPTAAVGSLWSLVQRGWGKCEPVLAVLEDLVTLGQTLWNCLVGLNLQRKQMLQREGEAPF